MPFGPRWHLCGELGAGVHQVARHHDASSDVVGRGRLQLQDALAPLQAGLEHVRLITLLSDLIAQRGEHGCRRNRFCRRPGVDVGLDRPKEHSNHVGPEHPAIGSKMRNQSIQCAAKLVERPTPVDIVVIEAIASPKSVFERRRECDRDVGNGLVDGPCGTNG